MQKVIVEYSKSQKAFHVSTWQERAHNERLCACNNVSSDYQVVAEFDTREEADEFISEMRETEKAVAR